MARHTPEAVKVVIRAQLSQGIKSGEIHRRILAGEAGLEPISISRRTLQRIIAQIRAESDPLQNGPAPEVDAIEEEFRRFIADLSADLRKLRRDGRELTPADERKTRIVTMGLRALRAERKAASTPKGHGARKAGAASPDFIDRLATDEATLENSASASEDHVAGEIPTSSERDNNSASTGDTHARLGEDDPIIQASTKHAGPSLPSSLPDRHS